MLEHKRSRYTLTIPSQKTFLSIEQQQQQQRSRALGGLARRVSAPPSSCASASEASPILDTHTTHSGKCFISPSELKTKVNIHKNKSRKFRPTVTASSKRIWSRCLLGLKVPGRYYFITLTSSPQSPDVKKGYDNFRKWLNKSRPKSSRFTVVTSEGCGVIHAIIRLGRGESRIDVKELRSWWQKVHKATQIKIKPVGKNHREKMANYLKDQDRKKGLGKEVLYQPRVIQWGYSKNWLPKGFGKAFGRFWHRVMQVTMTAGEREAMVHGWLMECMKNPSEVKDGAPQFKFEFQGVCHL